MRLRERWHFLERHCIYISIDHTHVTEQQSVMCDPVVGGHDLFFATHPVNDDDDDGDAGHEKTYLTGR
jgi:hypothetical protein